MSEQDAVFVDDADVEIGHQDEHALVSVGTSDTDVVQLASVNERHRSSTVDVGNSRKVDQAPAQRWRTIAPATVTRNLGTSDRL